MSRGRRLPLLLLAGLAGCSIARPPAESATRILNLDRQVGIWLVSSPPGRTVAAVGDDGRPGPTLGQTPLEIHVLILTKEIWKHADGIPPPPAAEPALLVLGQASRPGHRDHDTVAGAAFEWRFLITENGIPRQIQVQVSAADLRHGFETGRIEVPIPPARR